MSKIIVVTGASGFVAKHAILIALNAGYRVRGTLRNMAKADGIRQVMAEHCGEAANNLEFVEADLLSDDGWDAACDGVDAILHTAMVVPTAEPKDKSSVLKPALEGTMRVLNAARSANVGRVVMTSSISTVGYGRGNPKGEMHLTEADWTDDEKVAESWTYAAAKTRAEKAAWEFAGANDLQLTTIIPGMIVGPALDDDNSGSLDAVRIPMTGKVPSVLPGGFSAVDVRDVAAMHVNALEQDWTNGQRVMCAGNYFSFLDQASALAEAYPDRKLPKKAAPLWLMKFLAKRLRALSQIASDLETVRIYDKTRGEKLLGRPYISAKDAILSSADSMVKLGLV